MRARTQTPDIERAVVDVLTELLEDQDCTVGVGVPDGWKPTDPARIQVGWDGTRDDQRVVSFATIRITAWAATTTEAKRLARLAEGLLLEQPSARSLTGPFPARDDKNHAEVASFTIRWAARNTPIP